MTFKTCQNTEQKSLKQLLPTIERRFDHIEPITTKLAQEYLGDYLAVKNNKAYILEFKAEEKHTGNLFIEIWSNEGVNLGWFRKCRADYIIYHFLDNGKAYLINMAEFKKELIEPNHKQVKQNKHNQPNISVGLLVPVNKYPSVKIFK